MEDVHLVVPREVIRVLQDPVTHLMSLPRNKRVVTSSRLRTEILLAYLPVEPPFLAVLIEGHVPIPAHPSALRKVRRYTLYRRTDDLQRKNGDDWSIGVQSCATIKELVCIFQFVEYENILAEGRGEDDVACIELR